MTRQLLATATLLAILATGTSPTFAQTISFAEAFDRLDKSCAADIERHCATVQLGAGNVKACLEANRARNTPACNATVDEVFAQLAKRSTAQANVAKVCDHDIRQYCSQVEPGDGFRIQCLVQSTRVVSRNCQQTIADAGWAE